MLEWRDGRTPVSLQFDDIYFAVEGGLEESRKVFIENNRLPARFSEKQHAIGELGFGTGLNFFAAAEAFTNSSSPSSVLKFYSCEKYPLSKKDLAMALSYWPEIRQFSNLLVKDYPENPKDELVL